MEGKSITEGERLAAVEVEVRHVREGVTRVEAAVTALSAQLGENYALKSDLLDVRLELETLKTKRGLVQTITNAALVTSLILNAVAVYALFRG